jgi:hypothetical protein
MRRFSAFRAVAFSFGSKDLYRDVAQEWKGACLRYLLLVVAVCTVPGAVAGSIAVSAAIDKVAMPIIAQLPDISVRDGVVETDAPQPCLITYPQDDRVLAVIDTSGSASFERYHDAVVLLTRSAIHLRPPRSSPDAPSTVRSHDLSGVSSLRVSRDRLAGWAQAAKTWAFAAFYLFGIGVGFVYRVVLALIYALLGLLVASAMRTEMTYGPICRLAVVAMTPVMLADAVVQATPGDPGMWWSVACLATTLFLLFMAVRTNAPAFKSRDPIYHVDA